MRMEKGKNYYVGRKVSEKAMGAIEQVFSNPFAVQFTVLSIIGFWYLDLDEEWKRKAYSLYRFLSIFSVTSVMFIEIIDVCNLSKDSSKNAERLCAATITCMIALRTHMTLYNTTKFIKLQEKLSKFRQMKSNRETELEIINESAQRIKTTAKIFFCAAISVVIWTLIPILEGDRRLPFPFRLPLDIYKSPTFEILYVYLSLLLYVFSASVISNNLGFCSYMIQFNSHFEMLKRNLESIERKREEVVAERRLLADFKFGISNKEQYEIPNYWEISENKLKDEKTKEILKDVIETQKYIYEEIECFKQLYSITLLVHIIGLLFVVAVVEITGVDEDFTVQLTKRIFYISVGIFDVLIICYYGEEVKHKSTEIIHAIYMIPWHEMDISVQKILIVMTNRALKSSVIKAGGTIRLDLETFLNILRVAYNFVVLLRQNVY